MPAGWRTTRLTRGSRSSCVRKPCGRTGLSFETDGHAQSACRPCTPRGTSTAYHSPRKRGFTASTGSCCSRYSLIASTSSVFVADVSIYTPVVPQIVSSARRIVCCNITNTHRVVQRDREVLPSSSVIVSRSRVQTCCYRLCGTCKVVVFSVLFVCDRSRRRCAEGGVATCDDQQTSIFVAD